MTGIILAIVGLILTLIFGIYSVRNNKKSQKKISISFEKKECYSLFKEDINRLNIDINYKGKTIDNYLILFKATITNNGNLDIDKSRIFSPLKIIIDKNFKWLETNISEITNGVNADIKNITDNILELNWDLIKKNEKIEFEALIEIPQNKEIEEITEEFYKSISFDFRITDLNKIDKIIDSNSKEIRRKKSKQKVAVMSIIMLLFGLALFFSPEAPKYLSILPISQSIEYSLKSNDTTVSVTIKAKDSNQMQLKNKDIDEEISISEFNKKFQIQKVNSIIDENKSKLLSRILGITYVLTALWGLWRSLRKKKTATNKM